MDAQFYVVELNQSSCVDRDSSGPFWEQKNNDSKDFFIEISWKCDSHDMSIINEIQ